MWQNSAGKNPQGLTSVLANRFALYLAIAGMGAIGILYGVSHGVPQMDYGSVRSPQELDAQGRLVALEKRKATLNISGIPYPRASEQIVIAFSDEALQRRIDVEFADADSGLRIHARTHLRLPEWPPAFWRRGYCFGRSGRMAGDVSASRGRQSW